MPWITPDDFPTELDPKLHYGFVYVIENLSTGRLYIGKKFFWSKKIRIVAKKKKRFLAESDWRTYYGSSNALLADVKEFGKDNFKRAILHVCMTKSICAYMETREQFLRDVLLDPKYYNEFVGCRINGNHLAKWPNAWYDLKRQKNGVQTL
jgi:hypothetical protein